MWETLEKIIIFLGAIGGMLAAMFGGALTWKAFASRKPRSFYALQPSGHTALFILNPNIEHDVAILNVVNESGNSGLKVVWSDPYSKSADNIKIEMPNSSDSFNEITGIGKILRPKERLLLSVVIEPNVEIAPMRLMIERDALNYFASTPEFNVLVRRHGFKLRREKWFGWTRWVWQKFIARHRTFH